VLLVLMERLGTFTFISRMWLLMERNSKSPPEPKLSGILIMHSIDLHLPALLVLMQITPVRDAKFTNLTCPPSQLNILIGLQKIVRTQFSKQWMHPQKPKGLVFLQMLD
jgi:hypothetical protein